MWIIIGRFWRMFWIILALLRRKARLVTKMRSLLWILDTMILRRNRKFGGSWAIMRRRRRQWARIQKNSSAPPTQRKDLSRSPRKRNRTSSTSLQTSRQLEPNPKPKPASTISSWWALASPSLKQSSLNRICLMIYWDDMSIIQSY